jgi:uncharacterized RDD family membrane protein YckC
MNEKKITDIFQEKVVKRKERTRDGEWETIEKAYHEKRPVNSLSPLLRFVHGFVDILAMLILFDASLRLANALRISVDLSLLIWIIFPGYYILSEFYFQRTIGKFLTGSFVIDEFGRNPNFKTVFLRTVTRFVPYDAFSIFGEYDGRYWHDRWTKTYVVSASEVSLIERIRRGEKPKESDKGWWDEEHNWHI